MTRPRLRNILFFAAVFLVYFGLRAHTFLGEIVHDDGLFLYGAQAWASGQLPYRDFADHKPPGVFLFNAIPLVFFPFSLIAVKVHQMLWLSLAAAALYSLCRRYLGLASSLAAMSLFILFTGMRHTVQSGGLTEEWGLVFAVFAYWYLLRNGAPAFRDIFWSGVLLGIAAQCRQTFVFESLFALGAFWHYSKPGEGFGMWLKRTLALGAGMAAPEAAVSLFFWLNGIWWQYFEINYLFSFFYTGPARNNRPLAEIAQIQWRMIQNTGPFLLAPVPALLAYPWLPPKVRWWVGPLCLMYAGDMIAVSMSGEYYAHYYVQGAAAFCLLLGCAVEGFGRALGQTRLDARSLFRAPYALAVLVLLAGSMVLPVQRTVADYRKVFDDRRSAHSQYSFQREVAAAVHRMTYHTDEILLIGRTPNSVYFLSERYAGSRFYHHAPLWKEKMAGAVEARHRLQLLEDLQTRKPVILLLDLTRLESGDGLERVREYAPEALEYIRENYMSMDEVVPYFSEDWGWYGIRLEILVLRERFKFVRYHYHWHGDNAFERSGYFQERL